LHQYLNIRQSGIRRTSEHIISITWVYII